MNDVQGTRYHADDVVVERTGFRLSWGAIFAGLIVAMVVQLLLTALGLAVGFSIWDPGEGGLGTGAAIWAVISGLTALFAGGLAAGRLAGVLRVKDAAIHGMLVWGLTAIATLWLVGSGVSMLLGGVFSVVGRTAGAAVTGVAQAGGAVASELAGGDMSSLQTEIEQILRQTGDPALQPDTLAARAEAAQQTVLSDEQNEEVASSIVDLVQRTAGQVDRDDIVNVIAARTDLTRDEAERVATRVDSAVSNAQTRIAAAIDTVGARAEEVGQQAVDTTGTAAWLLLLWMLLTLAAASGGAAMTARA